jgi:hypothetical protein
MVAKYCAVAVEDSIYNIKQVNQLLQLRIVKNISKNMFANATEWKCRYETNTLAISKFFI